ncbi:hypothetical protein DFH28DRAFT_939437 [Melampsora americana]|nr:hypothetical protein DFH28DRAFT_939437 [Melampsora americana]
MLGGTLGVFGYHASYDDMIAMGGYVTEPSITKEEYNDVISELIPLENHLGTCFRELAPTAFSIHKKYLICIKNPQHLHNLLKLDNVLQTFTYKNFHNKAHIDNDKREHTYCIWVLISSRNGQIVTEAEGLNVEEYRITFYTPGNGLLQMVWSGKRLHHQTMHSQESLYTYLGRSGQLNQNLAAIPKNLAAGESSGTLIADPEYLVEHQKSSEKRKKREK